MKTKIGVAGAEFYSYHGFYPEENRMGHSFIVDAEVMLDLSHSDSDDLGLTVNYETIYSICRTHMTNTHKLLETVAYRMCEDLKNLSPEILSGRVIIKKKGVQLGGKTDHTFIEMFF